MNTNKALTTWEASPAFVISGKLVIIQKTVAGRLAGMVKRGKEGRSVGHLRMHLCLEGAVRRKRKDSGSSVTCSSAPGVCGEKNEGNCTSVTSFC